MKPLKEFLRVKMLMKLLGKCPKCEVKDEIAQMPYDKDFSNYHKVKCGNCETIWDDWLNLKFSEEKKGNRLIPVEVTRNGNIGVWLNWPSKHEIPHKGLIATVLNSALMTKFNLDVCFATEGGVQGKGFELRNSYHNFGIYTDYGENNATTVLDFYEKMMMQLFKEPLSFGNVNFRRGEILWLKDYKETCSDALIYLFGTLTVVESRKFAEKMLKTKEKVKNNPFSAPYLRGLSDEEIAKFWVPPPIKKG